MSQPSRRDTSMMDGSAYIGPMMAGRVRAQHTYRGSTPLGLWDWIVESITGKDERLRPVVSSGQSGSVAVMEDGLPDANGVPDDDPWWAPAGVTLTEPVEPQRPVMQAEAVAMEGVLVSQFDSHDLSLPPMSEAAEKVIRSLGELNFDSARVAADIAEDQVIAAAVLRMANSAMYGGRSKITAIPLAMTRLGATALRTLMIHQSMRAAAFERSASDRDLSQLVWTRSLAGACVMRDLAVSTNADVEEAFMMGLLHDIGNVIVLREVQKQQAVLRYKIDIETFDYLCSECHQEFGELLADAWRLPARLKSLIVDHHATPAEDDPYRTERLMLQATDMVNAMVGYGPAASYDLLRARPIQQLGLADREDFVDALRELPGLVELTIASVSF